MSTGQNTLGEFHAKKHPIHGWVIRVKQPSSKEESVYHKLGDFDTISLKIMAGALPEDYEDSNVPEIREAIAEELRSRLDKEGDVK